MRRSLSIRQAIFRTPFALGEIVGPMQTTIYFGRWKSEVEALPLGEKEKLDRIAEQVAKSFEVGGRRIKHILVEGHADHDKLGKKFEDDTSRERANNLVIALLKRIKAQRERLGKGPFPPGSIAVEAKALGSSRPHPKNIPKVTDFALNRRGEIFMSPEGEPVPPPEPIKERRMISKTTEKEEREDHTLNPDHTPPNMGSLFAKGLKEIIQRHERFANHPAEWGDPDLNPQTSTQFAEFPIDHVLQSVKIVREWRHLATELLIGVYVTRWLIRRKYQYTYGPGRPDTQVQVSRDSTSFLLDGTVETRFPTTSFQCKQPPNLADP